MIAQVSPRFRPRRAKPPASASTRAARAAQVRETASSIVRTATRSGQRATVSRKACVSVVALRSTTPRYLSPPVRGKMGPGAGASAERPALSLGADRNRRGAGAVLLEECRVNAASHVSMEAAELPLRSEEEQPVLAAADEIGARPDSPPDQGRAGPLNSQHGRRRVQESHQPPD